MPTNKMVDGKKIQNRRIDLSFKIQGVLNRKRFESPRLTIAYSLIHQTSKYMQNS